jgi:predicted nuclease of predicted toxin-antitoxin system
VTKDSDFYELSLVRGFPPKIVWLKCSNISNERLLTLLERHKENMIGFSHDAAIACLELY